MSESILKTSGAAFTWTHNGHSYGLFKQLKTWSEASAFARSIGGYLSKVDDAAENTKIFSSISPMFSASDKSASAAPDGGEATYVWLGASDESSEGSWIWAKDNSALSTSRAEWGKGKTKWGNVTEPDDSGGQDYLTMGITQWPKLTSYGKIGSPGQWNDVSGDNALYFVVEMDSIDPKDTAAPTLSSVTPADNAQNVAIDANFALTFNESVKAGKGRFTLKSGTKTVATIAASDTTQVSFSGSTVTINPKADLSYGSAYSLSAAAGTVTDSSGNAWTGAGLSAYDFTTAARESVAPTLASITPADNAGSVAIDANFVLAFDESVKAGKGSFVIKSGTKTVASIAASDTSQISFSGSTVTINPKSNLVNGTSYSLSATAGTITDTAGNAWSGSELSGYDFTTVAKDLTAPTLSSVTPADNAQNVAIDANFVLTFSESVKAGKGSFVIKSGTKTVATIAASDTTQVSFSGSTVTINPKSNLSGSTAYALSAAAGTVTDATGNAWAGTELSAYDFTTAGNSGPNDTTPPGNPGLDAWNIRPTSNLVLTFNEPIRVSDSHSIWLYEVDASYNQIGPYLAFSASASGATLTVDPTLSLQKSRSYSIGFDSGAIADLVGNSWPESHSSFSWIFSVS